MTSGGQFQLGGFRTRREYMTAKYGALVHMSTRKEGISVLCFEGGVQRTQGSVEPDDLSRDAKRRATDHSSRRENPTTTEQQEKGQAVEHTA